MITVKVPLQEAERAKQELMRQGYFLSGYSVQKEGDHLYFPVKERFDSPYAFEERALEARPEQPQGLRETLKGKLPADVLGRLKTAYDQVGDIAILEIDDKFKGYDATIGKALLDTNPKLRTVLAKATGHEGAYRTQHMRLLAGEDKRVAVHKENGVSLIVDVEAVYFSARLSTERKRIMERVQPGERVLVMFSGCGPYTCTLAKNTEAEEVVGVEINPRGHELAEENSKLNELTNVKNYKGDVREIVPELGEFDRILMPLPRSAETFLDVALGASHQGTIIHFYSFLHEDDYAQADTWIQGVCDRAGRRFELLGSVKCGQQAPRVFRWCTDVKIL
ncbi:class I SAM-dependent methyltransferase family protein [Candidatus Woesearchaeota archaeon]|nr:class I SAM-dependent methyltransferase family protein [Candidatus Woesearchaeota archaeon]